MKGTAPLLFAIVICFHSIEADISFEHLVVNESEICSQIGIEENAVLNTCGFCTEGDTGLDINYGFDCNHVCNGQSNLDCNNQCNGNSYIDVCTGICIKPIEDLTFYNHRDCRGICLNSVTKQYMKNECGQCKQSCTNDQQCISRCDHNETETSIVCDDNLGESDTKSLSDTPCYQCAHNYTLDCSCRLDPAVCGCNSSNDCYYISSIDPNVMPTNTPFDILVSGYFNGEASTIQCLLTNQREGTELSFEAKLLNTTSMKCIVNFTQAGQYLFGLQSNTMNNSNNTLTLSVYDYDLVFFSEMTPKKILTTGFTNSIDLMFEFQNQIIFNLKALLKCKIIYNLKQIVVNSNTGNSCTIPSSESHSNSQRIIVIPTFDGIHSVSNPPNFSLAIIAPFPKIVEEISFISKDGLFIIIAFDRPVHIFVPRTVFGQEIDQNYYCNFYLTNSTLNRLKSFGLIECKWLTANQFFIALTYPIDVHFIEISFKEQTIKEFGQLITETNTKDVDITVRKNIGPHPFYVNEPQILLRGPTLLPLCGPFSLSAYFYSPKGSTNVEFKWSVTTLPLRNDLISDKLFKAIDSNNKTSILLFGEMFSLEAISYILTISALFDDRTAIQVTHQLLRSSEVLPIVTIFPTPQPNEHSLTSHVSQTLYSEVSVPLCVKTPEPLSYIWKTNNPEIKYNFLNMTSADYQIDYSKHSKQTTTYEINVKMGNQSATSTASFTRYPIASEQIMDVSNQISIITLGQKSGKFKLSASLLDPAKSKSIGYLWSCHYGDSEEPCVLSSNPKQLLISRNIQNRRELSLSSESMRISEHKFGLQVIDTNGNISQVFYPYTTVRVVEGIAPQVFIDSVYVRIDGNNISLKLKKNESNVVSVPSNTRLVIRGVIRKSQLFDSIEWKLSHSIHQLNWNNRIAKMGIITELNLYPDQISPFGSYNISLKACKEKQVCSEVDIQLIAGPVLSQCIFTIERNQIINKTTFTTDRCNVPITRLPLTYQLYAINEDNQRMPLTAPQFSPVIAFDSFQLREQIYSIEVCDGYAFCQMINSVNDFEPESIKYENKSQEIDNLIERSQKYALFDPISALILLSPITNNSDQTLIDKLKAEYLMKISPENIKRRGELTLIYQTFGYLFRNTKDFRLKSDLIGSIKQLTGNSAIFTDFNTLDILYTNLLNFYSFENKVYHQINDSFGYFTQIGEMERSNYLSNIRHVFANIVNSCAKQIPIGKYVKLGSRAELPKSVTLITHQKRFSEISLTTKMNEWKNVSAFLKFNDKKVYKYWNSISQNTQNIVYNSVIYTLSIFPDQNPYGIGDKMHKLSPVVDISIHSPNSGQRLDTEFKVQNLKKEEIFDFIALLKVSLTGNETYGGTSYTTKCHYFNEKRRQWEMGGITELGISGSSCGCFINHLTTLSIFRVVHHISSDYIFGVLVAVLMGVLIFGIMLVFFVQKKEQTIKLKSIKSRSNSNTYLNSYKNSSDDIYSKSFVY